MCRCIMVVKLIFAKPILKRDRDKISMTHTAWRTMLLLLLFGINPFLSAFATEAPVPTQKLPDFLTLPDFGDPSGALISPIEEQQLGAEFMRSIRRSAKVIDDPQVEEYIQDLGYRLVAGADPQPYRFTYFVVRDPEINAFAGPGGYIGVNSGLILLAQSESELAAVLAHETAHVTQHHLLRTFAKESRISVPTMAALLAALVLGSHSPQFAEAAIASTMAGSQQLQINFTRENELEADRVGMQILVSAGYDPRNMAAFFEKLQKATRFDESGVPKLLLDHPVTSERIAYSSSRAEQYPHITPPDDLPFELIRAKLRVITADDPAQVVQYFESALKQKTYTHEQAARYGYALALLGNDQIDQAHEQIKWLLEKSPNRIPYLIAEAQLESAVGKGKDALKIYSDALQLYPRHYPLTILYSEELLHEGQAATARQLLQEYLRHRDARPLVYKLLAQSENDEGSPIESEQALAEYDYLNGQTQSAIDHLNRALRMTKKDDFYHASRIEARLKELKQQAQLEGSQKSQ
jgi:beta-barrel assembly-enhancing protease